MYLIVIDSGTSTTRIRLTDGEQVIASKVQAIGAKDVAVTGSKQPLLDAIQAGMEEVLQAAHIRMDEVAARLASGMITSPSGLLEVPHIAGPVSVSKLAQGVVHQRFAGEHPLQISFIPGVKTGMSPTAELGDKDMMRGEETEIAGFLRQHPEYADKNVLFMHYGSHHKCMQSDRSIIRACRTAMTGELMMALMQHTILKDSVVPLDDLVPSHEWVREGLKVAEQAGFGRALFSSRVLQVLEQRSRLEATSFMLGALVSLDLMLLQEMMHTQVDAIVMYGRSLYPSITAPILAERHPHISIHIVTEQESELLSVYGAMQIYRQSKMKE